MNMEVRAVQCVGDGGAGEKRRQREGDWLRTF